MTIDHDALRRSARADLRFGLGGESARDVLALLDALTRVEAQSETRRLQVAYWQDQYGQMEADRDDLRHWRIEAEFDRDAATAQSHYWRDLHIKSEAKIQAVRDVLDRAHDDFENPTAFDIRRALDGTDRSDGR